MIQLKDDRFKWDVVKLRHFFLLTIRFTAETSSSASLWTIIQPPANRERQISCIVDKHHQQSERVQSISIRKFVVIQLAWSILTRFCVHRSLPDDLCSIMSFFRFLIEFDIDGQYLDAFIDVLDNKERSQRKTKFTPIKRNYFFRFKEPINRSFDFDWLLNFHRQILIDHQWY